MNQINTLILSLFCICLLKTGHAQPALGLDCNQPIDNITGAIASNATAAVVATTCTPWVRLNFILGPWSSPSDQTLHSGKTWKQTYDEIVNGFLAQGIQVYALISDQAAGHVGDVLKFDPSNDQAATDAWIAGYVTNFVDIVGHFKDRITTFESFNEPNNWNNGVSVVHPKWFAKILQEIYMETKYYNGHDTDPSWQVNLVSGPIFTHALDDGASYIGSTYSHGINDFAWSWILANKGTYPLDGFGMHIYAAQGTSDPSQVSAAMNTNINAFWNSIASYEGTTNKKIWVSEFGWESNAVGFQGQADNLTTGFNLLKNDSRIALATWFSLTDWPGASWGLYQLGSFIPSERKLSFDAFKNQVSCYPVNLQSVTSCVGTVSFNWENSGNGWFLDVSTDAGFASYSNISVSNVTSISGPSGFNPAITFQPNTTYYWRMWNNAVHTFGGTFTVQPCVTPTNLSASTDCNGNVNFSWTNSGSGWSVDVTTDPNFSFYYNKNVSGQTTTSGPAGFACDIAFAPCSPGTLSFQPNTTYYWRIWNGNTHTIGSSFTISAAPAAPVITPNGSTTFCQGGSVILDAGAGYASYSWNTGATAQTFTANSGGSYSVTVTDNNNCSASSSATVVTVNLLPPAPVITLNGSDLLSTTASTYQWFLNGDSIPGATSQNYSPVQSGNYSILITDANGCSATSSLYNYTSTNGIGAKERTWMPVIYPNPNNGTFTVEIMGLVACNHIRIYNTLGELVFSKTLDILHNSHSIQMFTGPENMIPSGIYSIELSATDKIYRTAIVVRSLF
jgi:hypothetical protein